MILSELWEMGKDREAWHVESSSVQLLNHVRLFVTPWTAAHQAPPSMRLSRQEYWNGLPLPSLQSELVSTFSLH